MTYVCVVTDVLRQKWADVEGRKEEGRRRKEGEDDVSPAIHISGYATVSYLYRSVL